jgi:hypothetical protein
MGTDGKPQMPSPRTGVTKERLRAKKAVWRNESRDPKIAALILLSNVPLQKGAKRVCCMQCLHLFYAVHKCLQFAAARRMAQLAQRLGFDLANALARDLEALSNFFQRVF